MYWNNNEQNYILFILLAFFGQIDQCRQWYGLKPEPPYKPTGPTFTKLLKHLARLYIEPWSIGFKNCF